MMTGTARKNSTTSQLNQRTAACSESLPTPKTRPKTRAPSTARTAIVSVSSQAWPIARMMLGVTNGSHRAYSN